MARVLILEDMPERVERLLSTLRSFSSVDPHVTADPDKAADWCERKPFDLFFLDHDLSDEHYHGAYSRAGTGLDFVNWFVRDYGKRHSCNPLFVVHSWNPSGSAQMVQTLEEYGYTVVKLLYGKELLRAIPAIVAEAQSRTLDTARPSVEPVDGSQAVPTNLLVEE